MINKAARLALLLILFIPVLAMNGERITPVAAQTQPSGTPFRFLVFGDMGTGDREQLAVANAMTALHQNHPFDTVIMLGDNIYPDGNPADIHKKFELPYAELLKLGVRFYATLGNHDVKKGREAQINYPNFNMGGRNYYSFIKGSGLVEFFSFDSTEANEQQIRWLDSSLGASKARWRVVFFHHPIYSSGKTHGSDLRLRGLIEPVLVRHRVTAVFSGHDHLYERIKPQQGVQYFVTGAGGKLRKGNLNRQNEFFEAGDDQHLSFMMIEATPTEFRYSAVTSDGEVVDSGVIGPVVAAGGEGKW